MAQQTRVLIADDSARAREGLRALLATLPEIAVVGEATNGQEAVAHVATLQPDVVLMDLHMPLLDGCAATAEIKRRWPAVAVIALTMYAAEQSAALAAGVDAFLIKGAAPEQLVVALGIGAAHSQR